MNTLAIIKKTRGAKDSKGIGRGWIVYYNDKDDIIEIKSLYNPNKYNGHRKVYSDDEIIDKLTKYKKK
jgi:hypothetical protein